MANWEERSNEHTSLKLLISDEVQETMKKRHLNEEEIQFAIYHAEAAGDTMYEKGTNRFLAKCVVGEGQFFAEYIKGEESGEPTYNICTVYACRTKIKE